LQGFYRPSSAADTLRIWGGKKERERESGEDELIKEEGSRIAALRRSEY
jgi:hypothetical protein